MPERVAALADEVAAIARERIAEIQDVTGRTRLLAINALIEAAHAGVHGRGFAVVAQEVGEVSLEVKEISASLSTDLASRISELSELGGVLVRQVRGSRLADLALNMIDVIDRNLYERSCDVRWWATDSSVVDACGAGTAGPESAQHASHRLGVILDSYTVYLDLWVADRSGRVVANGRPERYPHARGSDVSGDAWFVQAMRTTSGADYCAVDIERSSTLGGQPVATYSTAIRAGGAERGEPIGALGIFFDWGPQADGVVRGVRVAAEDQGRTRCLLVDADHRVIAASDGRGLLEERFALDASSAMGFYQTSDGTTVGYARTPGYETYRGLGWYGVIEQRPAKG